jgi:hypothetical protein
MALVAFRRCSPSRSRVFVSFVVTKSILGLCVNLCDLVELKFVCGLKVFSATFDWMAIPLLGTYCSLNWNWSKEVNRIRRLFTNYLECIVLWYYETWEPSHGKTYLRTHEILVFLRSKTTSSSQTNKQTISSRINSSNPQIKMQSIITVTVASAVEDKSAPVGHDDIPTYSPCNHPTTQFSNTANTV